MCTGKTSRGISCSQFHCTTPVKEETDCFYAHRSGKFARLPNQLIRRLSELAPRLRPELLHRVITVYGLEDCVDLVAQATPAQLSHVFDLDLWRPARPGIDEQFDAGRFGVWIEVLVEAGVEIAAAKLAEMPLRQIVAGLAHHVVVFDVAAVSAYETTDGTRLDYSRPVRDRVGCEVGGYHVAATREDSWDAIVAVLVALDMHHPDRFVELMRAVRSRSHSLRERDGFYSLLQNRDQMMFDVADERERRRETRGFLSPAAARAFLQMSRSVRPGALAAANPIARAYFRSIDTTPAEDAAPAQPDEVDVEVAELLAEAGVLPQPAPRALLTGGESESSTETTRIQALMQMVFDRDQVAYGDRNAELAYLANVLIAGCAIQSRPFTAKEASDAVVAICSLGLEQMPATDDFLLTHDLVGVFQLGWAALYERVCVRTANSLIDTLARVRVGDDDIQGAINILRIQLMKQTQAGTPWQAAPALEAIMMLDQPAWIALVSLIAECPVLHAALLAPSPIIPGAGRKWGTDPTLKIDPAAFEWISAGSQIEMIRTFLDALPEILNAR